MSLHREEYKLGLSIKFVNQETCWGTTLKYLDVAIPRELYPDMRTIYLTFPYAETDPGRGWQAYNHRHREKYYHFKLDSKKKMKSLFTKLKNKEKKHAYRPED